MMLILCQGYKGEPHYAKKLHAKGLCLSCYMHKYREEHAAELRAYQEVYRTGEAYKEMNRQYAAKHREKKYE
jgi:hypothetical protein